MKLTFIAYIVAFFVWASPAFAQNHTDIVASVKSTVQQSGVDFSRPCGIWQITWRVAWALRGEGAGLAFKADDPKCQGYAVDTILYVDGRTFTIFADPGLAPAWKQIDFIDPNRYRAPMDPGGGIVVPPSIPTPTVTTPPPPISMEVFSQLTALQLAHAQLAAREEERDRQFRSEEHTEHTAISTQIADAETAITEAINDPGWVTKVFENRYVQLALAAGVTLLTTQLVKGSDVK